jgi:hypothetical protein
MNRPVILLLVLLAINGAAYAQSNSTSGAGQNMASKSWRWIKKQNDRLNAAGAAAVGSAPAQTPVRDSQCTYNDENCTIEFYYRPGCGGLLSQPQSIQVAVHNTSESKILKVHSSDQNFGEILFEGSSEIFESHRPAIRTIADNYGNEFNITSISTEISKNKKAPVFDDVALYPGRGVSFYINIDGEPVSSTRNLVLRVPRSLFGNGKEFEADIPVEPSANGHIKYYGLNDGLPNDTDSKRLPCNVPDLSTNPEAAGATIGLMETELFGKVFSGEDFTVRLSRLETTVFPSQRPRTTMSMIGRVQRLINEKPNSKGNGLHNIEPSSSNGPNYSDLQLNGAEIEKLLNGDTGK